jgi:hypothetical protein
MIAKNSTNDFDAIALRRPDAPTFLNLEGYVILLDSSFTKIYRQALQHLW